MFPYYTRPNKMYINDEEIPQEIQEIEFTAEVTEEINKKVEDEFAKSILGYDKALHDGDYTCASVYQPNFTKEEFEEICEKIGSENSVKVPDRYIFNLPPLELKCEFKTDTNFFNLMYRNAINPIQLDGYYTKTIITKRHKKRRINKKWNKKYGYKYIQVKDKNKPIGAFGTISCLA